jgi:hypothetical protein
MRYKIEMYFVLEHLFTELNMSRAFFSSRQAEHASDSAIASPPLPLLLPMTSFTGDSTQCSFSKGSGDDSRQTSVNSVHDI